MRTIRLTAAKRVRLADIARRLGFEPSSVLVDPRGEVTARLSERCALTPNDRTRHFIGFADELFARDDERIRLSRTTPSD